MASLDQLFSRTDDDYIYATRHMSPPELRQRLGGRFSRLVHPWTSFVVLVLVLVLMLMPVMMSALVLALVLVLVLALLLVRVLALLLALVRLLHRDVSPPPWGLP